MGAKGRHMQLTDVAPKQLAYNIKLINISCTPFPILAKSNKLIWRLNDVNEDDFLTFWGNASNSLNI